MSSVRAYVFAFCACIVWSSPSIAQSRQGCLSYQPVVKLSGTIVSKTYPGPPEYTSIRHGDEPETYWLLALPMPVCVDEDQASPDVNPAVKNIRRIQLVFPDETVYKKYRRLLWKRVVATGTLYGGTTIHHKTRVLLDVESLVKAK